MRAAQLHLVIQNRVYPVGAARHFAQIAQNIGTTQAICGCGFVWLQIAEFIVGFVARRLSQQNRCLCELVIGI